METATHYDRAEIFRAFDDAARRGDWESARRLAQQIVTAGIPLDPEEFRAHHERLIRSVQVARVARANLAQTLVRINAAARFAAST